MSLARRVVVTVHAKHVLEHCRVAGAKARVQPRMNPISAYHHCAEHHGSVGIQVYALSICPCKHESWHWHQRAT